MIPKRDAIAFRLLFPELHEIHFLLRDVFLFLSRLSGFCLI
jgi:hypothetical protein